MCGGAQSRLTASGATRVGSWNMGKSAQFACGLVSGSEGDLELGGQGIEISRAVRVRKGQPV